MARIHKKQIIAAMIKRMIGTQPRIVVASAGMIVLALVMIYGLLRLVSTPWNGMLQFGSTSFIWQFIPLIGAMVLWNISWLLFVVSGFRRHWGWGLGILLLPAVSLLFFFYQPRQSRRPALIWLFGTVLLLIVVISKPHG